MTAITIYENFDNMQRAAIALQSSGYFQDAKSEAQAIVKVMAGAELGIPPFAAMTGIHVIKGKPVLSANLIATLISQHPVYSYRVKSMTNDGCTIVFYENGNPIGESAFTAADAKAAGLNGDNWRKFPRNMMFARAISNGARWFCPAIFGGAPVYTPDELGAQVDEDGDIIEAVYTTTPERVMVEEAPQPEAPDYDADEQMVFETEAKLFVSLALRLLPYYKAPQHLVNAAKKCGHNGIPGNPAERVELFRCLRNHAETRIEEQAEMFADDAPANGAYED